MNKDEIYLPYAEKIRYAIQRADEAGLISHSSDAAAANKGKGLYIAASNLEKFLLFLQTNELLIRTP